MKETTYEKIKQYIESFNYIDYDETRLFTDRTVSYHSDIKFLQGDFASQIQTITGERLACKNIQLIEQFKYLHEIYANFEEHALSDLHDLRGLDVYSIIDYVLYRMNIKNIDTLTLNMFGIRKLTLNEY